MNSNRTPCDNSRISKDKTTVTYTAVPCPLPEAWQAELKSVQSGDTIGREYVERRMRAAIGFEVSRPAIPPTGNEVPRMPTAMGAVRKVSHG